MTTAERFASVFAKTVFAPSGCWLFNGARNTVRGRMGYAQTTVRQRRVYLHRWLYEAAAGPIPGGLEIDHLCRTPNCIRPSHLEAVSHSENVRRGRAWHHLYLSATSKTHCKQGHAFDAVNTRIAPNGWRKCRACARRWKAERRARRRAA